MITGDQPKTKQDPLDSFLAKHAEIDVLLKRIQAKHDDHYDVHPEEVTWGHTQKRTGYSTCETSLASKEPSVARPPRPFARPGDKVATEAPACTRGQPGYAFPRSGFPTRARARGQTSLQRATGHPIERQQQHQEQCRVRGCLKPKRRHRIALPGPRLLGTLGRSASADSTPVVVP